MNRPTIRKKNSGRGKWKYWAYNIPIAIVILVIIYFGSGLFLRSFTNHGDKVTVPALEKMSVGEASALARDKGLDVKVTDTAYVFTDEFDKGDVISQFPKAGSSVKPGRVLRLTINAPDAKMIKMPNLMGLSRRDAVAKLRTLHLVMGRKTFVTDIETGRVQKQMHNGKVIEEGEMIPAGSVVDVHLGRNEDNLYTVVPNFIDMTYSQVVKAIEDSDLNAGKFIFDRKDPGYKKKMEAVVYRQSLNADQRIETGSTINIYLHIQD